MTLLDELQAGDPAQARSANSGDSVDGVVPEVVVSPRRTEEVAAALQAAARFGRTVVARGRGTKLDWGNPPVTAGLLIDLSRMDDVIEHVSDDLVARAQAGVTLARLSEVLGQKRQRFPVDEVVAGSTLGGVVATGLSGPSRYIHGSVRDLVLGMTVVRADGTVVRAGSKVVKNVAGYDLSKLFTGSYGTLGVIAEVTLKLRPLPAARLFVTAAVTGSADFAKTMSGLLASQTAPSAIELDHRLPGSAISLSVLIEGRPKSVEQRAGEVASLMGASSTTTVDGPSDWARLPGPVTFKLTALLSAIPVLVDKVDALVRDQGLTARLSGSAGAGVLYMGVPEDVPAEQLVSLLAGVRRAAEGCGGYATVLRSPSLLKRSLDVWGVVSGTDLMHRVKRALDPDQRLAPGRFVGGI